MANANPDSSTGPAGPSSPTVLVILRCTLPQPFLQQLFALGAADYLPADGPAQQWLAATAPAAGSEPGPAPLAAQLSPCEWEIVRLIGQGHTTAAIARLRHRSTTTVESQKSRLKRKLGFETQMQLSQWACRLVDRETTRRAA